MHTRTRQTVISSIAAADEAGIKLRRTLRHDPFLMSDEFFSDNPEDYLQGFPSQGIGPHSRSRRVRLTSLIRPATNATNQQNGTLGPVHTTP